MSACRCAVRLRWGEVGCAEFNVVSALARRVNPCLNLARFAEEHRHLFRGVRFRHSLQVNKQDQEQLSKSQIQWQGESSQLLWRQLLVFQLASRHSTRSSKNNGGDACKKNMRSRCILSSAAFEFSLIGTTREVAAAAAMNNQAAPSNTASTLAHTSIQPPSTPSSQPTSSWSSLLGLWAWKKGETPQNQDNLEGKGKP